MKSEWLKELEEKLNSMTQEELDKEFKELEKWNNVGPTVEEYMETVLGPFKGMQPVVFVLDGPEVPLDEARLHYGYLKTRKFDTSHIIPCDPLLLKKYLGDNPSRDYLIIENSDYVDFDYNTFDKEKVKQEIADQRWCDVLNEMSYYEEEND